MRNHIKQIVEIEKETFSKGGVNSKTLDSINKVFKDGLIIIEEEGLVLAYLGWEKHKKKQFPTYNHNAANSHNPDGKLAYISIITVKKEFRNQGLGSKLLKILEKIALKHNCMRIYCPVNKSHPYLNKGVMKFWKKNSYRITGETDWEISKGRKLASFVFSRKIN